MRHSIHSQRWCCGSTRSTRITHPPWHDDKGKGGPRVPALLSLYVSAVVAVFEMDNIGDCLSGNSFGFLFPVLWAALMGPRNVLGATPP